MIFQYYESNIKASKPLGDITLERFITAIKSPSKNIQDVFNAIKQAEQNKDMKLKAELKTKLYSFTPCAYVNGRRKYSDIIHFTGLFILDFDHLPNEEYSREFQQYVFNEYDFIIASWLSPSRHGVKCILKIPISQNVDEFKLYYNALEEKFKDYLGFDKAVKNCILPLFLSYDPLIIYRDNAVTWTKKLHQKQPTLIKQWVVKDKTRSIYTIIKNKIDPIVDNGHPQLRAAAYLLGGYVGANHIDYLDAENMIISLINSNAYLSQKASVYITTSKQMIKKGINQPVFLK